MVLRLSPTEMARLTGTKVSTPHRAVGGTREDLGFYTRSMWERNYCRYLKYLQTHGQIAAWAYEAHTFEFVKIRRGTRFYTPDFKVTFPDDRIEWHEVKGWMDPKSATRLKRMARYFPDQKVVVIDHGWFRQAMRSGLVGAIPGWERVGR